MRSAVLMTLLIPAAHGILRAAELPHVPAGYTARVVAEFPLVKHPMMATFDDRGRMFIAESAGTNRKAEELIDEPLDFIRMLEDTDGDGVYDKSTIFADKLTFPQGVLCHEGIVYTCAPPYVWKLEDTDDDGVCDERTILVQSFGFNGNAASIHGPFLGPEGRLYWCDGRHGHEFFDATGELVSKGKAARIFSCNLDGSDVRTFCGGGMDNPVEVDWLPSGEMIGTVNLFYGRPRGDVLVHWVEGGVYPRFDQQDCIDEFTWTGGLLPEIHNYGHVAVSGMCRERSGPTPQQDGAAGSFLVTLFNTHKVVRTTLAREGSTFKAIGHEDLVVWDNPDVHPTDVLEAPDGSILVIDTGGWFRIGCPTSQIAKPEIPGAIYRITRDDPADAPGGEEEAVAGIPPGPHEARLWLSVGSAAQRLAAAQQIAQVFDRSSRPGSELPVRQFAPAVLAAIADGDLDAHLSHALTLALIRIGAVDITRQALEDDSPAVRRAALIALDQMPGGELSEQEVIRQLETDDPRLLETVLDIIARHEGWVAETVPMFRQWLLDRQPTEQRIHAMRTFFLAQAQDLWVQELVSDAISLPKTHPAIRLMLIDIIARANVDSLPPAWGDVLQVPLGLESDPESRLASMRAIATRHIEQHDGWLTEIMADDRLQAGARIEAFAAVAPRLDEVPADFFNFGIRQLSDEGDLLEKLTLAQGFADAPLDEARLTILARSLAAIGPAVAPVLLPAFRQSSSAVVGQALIEGLSQLGDSLSLSPQELERLLSSYPDEIKAEARPLLDALQSDVAEQAARLEELQQLTSMGGDASRGRAVFFGKEAGCSVCHQVGNAGGQIGPALTNIGAIRQPRDLLEAIAFPSASFAREFRPFTVLTDEGRVHTGIISARSSETVTLRTADLKEIRIPSASIEEMRQSDTSIMPKGLDAKLTPAELADLIAYLRSLQGDS